MKLLGPLTSDDIHDDGGLLCYSWEGETGPLGYLAHFPGRGVYDAGFGKVPVSPDVADLHNKVLDEALVLGLDNNCEVGQGGYFYVDGDNAVTTWLGTAVGRAVERNGRYRFTRLGRRFVGKVRRDQDVVFFKRVR